MRAANHRLCGDVACRRRAKRDRQLRNPTILDDYRPQGIHRIDDGGRECSRCRTYKPWSDFYVVAKNKTGHSTWCKDCTRSQRNRRYTSARSTPEDSDFLRLQRKAYLYGVPVDEIRRLEAVTSCDLCDEPIDQSNRVIDHCHDTGAIRGVLCRPCNLALGILGDSYDRILRAAAYLARTADVLGDTEAL